MAEQKGRPCKQPEEHEEPPRIENEEPVNEDDHEHNEQPENEDELTLEPRVAKAISDVVCKIMEEKLPALFAKALKDTLEDEARKIVNVGENRAQNGVRMLPESRNEDKTKIWPPWTRAISMLNMVIKPILILPCDISRYLGYYCEVRKEGKEERLAECAKAQSRLRLGKT
ncbi:hypothetical protein E3N88_35413 [Mikania micrantha]|uniref:Uncharacterized protein n=1 Tax=Mikania micrantha TaxID=192012 RepID=A0A5N6M3N7_9ASTR|nr:hypothetical protein E3N88_35413 [Mikania micrantha]